MANTKKNEAAAQRRNQILSIMLTWREPLTTCYIAQVLRSKRMAAGPKKSVQKKAYDLTDTQVRQIMTVHAAEGIVDKVSYRDLMCNQEGHMVRSHVRLAWTLTTKGRRLAAGLVRVV